MKKQFLILLCFGSLVSCLTSAPPEDFTTNTVARKIKDFPDTLNLQTPLKAGISYAYLLINGKTAMLRPNSFSGLKNHFPPVTAPDSPVAQIDKNALLHTIIEEVMVYKDSVSLMITKTEASGIMGRWLARENHHWVNYSKKQELFNTLPQARKYFKNNAPLRLKQLRHLNRIKKVPQDTLSLVTYLQKNAVPPKDFILKKLETHKLVLYGDIHFRKWSWNICREVIKDKRFAQTTGKVFIELGANMQENLDRFMEKDTLDKELLLNVFREYKFDGWDEKGVFDFIVDLWKVNKVLPVKEKVKIILVDTPRTPSAYQTLEAVEASHTLDRDKHMAAVIEKHLKEHQDTRNSFFTVGTQHIAKLQGTAGAILTQKFPQRDLYFIFTHSPQMHNRIDIPERVRHGVFDYAFCRAGNVPLAFELKNSPFGKEPFDALYDNGSGNYEDNYDGYIFFGPLDEEPEGDILIEMYTDTFITELNRRYALHDSDIKDWWGIEDGTKEAVIEHIRQFQNQKRWENILESVSGCDVQNQ
ncbi:hypothetical protein [Ascidiimonas aurantiaca]|uniref:hypothetical protein n=1 Tax=Ascidiimonas aurantiaca TaxID=1685432 RepID=UPI0030EB6985